MNSIKYENLKENGKNNLYKTSNYRGERRKKEKGFDDKNSLQFIWPGNAIFNLILELRKIF